MSCLFLEHHLCVNFLKLSEDLQIRIIRQSHSSNQEHHCNVECRTFTITSFRLHHLPTLPSRTFSRFLRRFHFCRMDLFRSLLPHLPTRFHLHFLLRFHLQISLCLEADRNEFHPFLPVYLRKSWRLL